MTPPFYILGYPNHPWGDYGDILTQGMACRADNGRLEIKRTGPFVPAITLPGIGEIVVTDRLRAALERSTLKGLTFAPVIKKLIVRSDWHGWEQEASEPAEHPASGEPEDYMLGKTHSPEAAEEMGNLWNIDLNRDAQTHRAKEVVLNRRQIKLVKASWHGQDIFGAQGVGFIYVTDAAKLWFESNVPGHLTFEEASTD